MRKVLLDTDIGSDIDDALCLAWLLRQPECELLGVTTVSGESNVRAEMASVLCTAAGREDIPIYPGVEAPLRGPQLQPIAKQKGVLAEWLHRADFPCGEAVEFLRRTIRQHPGEITLLGIGPMTNLGLLFAVDPEIPSLLKEVCLMCGIFTYKLAPYTCLAEWNARCDPPATAIVYDAPLPRLRSVGLDVTTRVTMRAGDLYERLNDPVLKPLRSFSNVWHDPARTVTFHDPLAAVCCFDERVCGFERGNVSVETSPGLASGLTWFAKDEDGNDDVALTVDANRFFDNYFSDFRV